MLVPYECVLPQELTSGREGLLANYIYTYKGPWTGRHPATLS